MSQARAVDLRLFRDGDSPLYVQIADAVRARIAEGEYRAGDKLPSVRMLSDELGVNPATVVSAYRILANEGTVEAKAGSGAFVAPESPFILRARGGIYGASEGASSVDLTTNMPPRELYPLEAVKKLLIEAVDEEGSFDYQDAAGYRPLREAVARLQGWGAGSSPDDIHIVSGAQQGLDLVARVFLRRGDVAAVEEPGYQGAADAFLAAGARIATIPVGGDGIDLDELERIASSKPLRLVYVNPDFQNPTGVVYGVDARERLAAMAAKHGFFVVEDSQVSDLSFDLAVPPPVASFDRHGRACFVKSFSKSVMPGLRIAFLKAPEAFQRRFEAAKRSIDLSSGGLLQRVLERFLSSGAYDAHLAMVRERYRRSASILTDALSEARGLGLEWEAPRGGLNLWLALPPGIDQDRFAAELERKGFMAASASVFMRSRGRGTMISPRGHLRVCYGHAADDELASAGKAIAALAAERRAISAPGG